VPHEAQVSPAVPRATTSTPAVPHAAVAPHAAMDGPPPREWPSSLIVYTKRPRQPAPYVPTGPALMTSDQRPPTAVPVTPPTNPH
jgi:hypothetical protein